MTWPDIVNGLFEVFAGLFVLNHCRVLYKDKMVRGASVISTGFFFLWGIWNLYYYPHLDQWASFAGGLLIVCANFLWVGMMIYYVRLERRVLTLKECKAVGEAALKIYKEGLDRWEEDPRPWKMEDGDTVSFWNDDSLEIIAMSHGKRWVLLLPLPVKPYGR